MTVTAGSAELLALAEEVRERTGMKYAGDCKCGKCQLLPRSLVERIYHTLNSLAAKPAEEVREDIARIKVQRDNALLDMERFMNEASGAREATIRECAAIAKAHKGAAQRARKTRGKSLHLGVDGYDEIVSEERGEDIASEIIEREILALSTGAPKP